MDYAKAVENIAKKNQIKNDYQTARYIGITAKELGRIREGSGSPVAKLKIMDKLGYTWAREALKHIMPKKAYEKYLEFDKERTKKKVQQD